MGPLQREAIYFCWDASSLAPPPPTHLATGAASCVHYCGVYGFTLCYTKSRISLSVQEQTNACDLRDISVSRYTAAVTIL